MSLGSEPLLLELEMPPPPPRLGLVSDDSDSGGWWVSECLACRRL